MNFYKFGKEVDDPAASWRRGELSINDHQSIWPELFQPNVCGSGGSRRTPTVDRHEVKTLEKQGLINKVSLHDHRKNEDRTVSEDLYRFSGDLRHKRAEQVIDFEVYEARIRDLEARLAVQTEKLASLIAAQVLQLSHESADIPNGTNRSTNFERPADAAHFVFDRNGNGQLVGPNGEHQYNLINGQRVWLKDTNDVRSGCSNGSCASCSGCRPRQHRFR